MSLTPEQALAVSAPASVAVTAGAGAGKTHMLAERYVHLLRGGLSPLAVVAVTFTEKAALELRARIRDGVSQAMPDRPDLVAELEAAPIGTLHALAARVCREHPDEAGASQNFAILDELEGHLWKVQQLDGLVGQLPDTCFAQVPHSLLCQALEALLADPLAAESAFQQDPSGWPALIEATRREALERLVADPAWIAHERALQQLAGEGRLEAMRAQAVGAAAVIRAAAASNTAVPEAFEAIKELKVNVGSQKEWPPGDCARAKEAIKGLRELGKEALQAGLVTLAWGEADDRLAALLPTLAFAFDTVRKGLDRAKQQVRLLDFSDLEVHALEALADPGVQAYYATRWQAFLVDEFQDTNPVQAELIERLSTSASLTIVGDEKQSIYGFRRADSSVFQRFAASIKAQGGLQVSLATSFRTHGALVGQINQLFAPLLANAFQALSAHRREAPNAGPHLEAFAVASADGTTVSARRHVEAAELARRLKHLLDAGTLVHDKPTGTTRPLAPGDIAVLSRTWGALDAYGDALEAAGIPVANAGGGNLLSTREALDGWAWLRFLADPSDSLALAAVLRGPFFAVSDRVLFTFARALPRGQAWWSALQADCPGELAQAHGVLKALYDVRRFETPSRLLQQADRLCGYTAVLANLPGARRRSADWSGFLDFLRAQERRDADLPTLARRLQSLLDAEIEVPRPPLEAGQAVALMTVHAAKGLEWPVVVVPDLTRGNPPETAQVYVDAALGVALKLEDALGEPVAPALYRILKDRKARREAAERVRVLYVALTRVRDRLLLSGAGESGGSLDLLAPALQGAGVVLEVVPFDPEDAGPPPLALPVPPSEPTRLLLEPVLAQVAVLPVTALARYESCPRSFKYRYVEGHPGLGEGSGQGARVGTLTHLAIERGIDDAGLLARFDPGLPEDQVQEALDLARRFRTLPLYAPFREPGVALERRMSVSIGSLRLEGIIDHLGPAYVLDYKTDGEVAPENHRLQLWAYAQATGRPLAHLAYLRHDQVVTFDARQLALAGEDAARVARGIAAGQFDERPSLQACPACPYVSLCAGGQPYRHVQEANRANALALETTGY